MADYINDDLPQQEDFFIEEYADGGEIKPFGFSTKTMQSQAAISSSLGFNKAIEPIIIDNELFENKSDYDKTLDRSQLGNYNAIQANRASQQPWYDQLGNALNQAVLGEIVGGTIMSVGALFDPLIRTTESSEQDFHNFIYDLGNNLSKWTQESTPIYRDPNKRFSDSGWWFQGGTSLVSAASMVIPGLAVSKGIKFLGGLMKLSKLGTAGVVGLDLAETFGGALAMRHAENFREASGVYDNTLKAGEAKVDSDINLELQNIQKMLQPTMESELNNLPPITVGPESPYYQEQVINRKLAEENIKNKYNSIYEAEAQKIYATRSQRLNEINKVASDAASMDYTANYANLIFDVIQLGVILKPFKGYTRNIKVSPSLAAADEVVSGVSRGAKTKAGKLLNKVARYEGLSQVTEGFEESINTINQLEGERKGRIDLGIEEDDGSSFGDRLINQHLGSAELWDSFMWGIAGGVAFHHIGNAINGDVSGKNKILEVAERKESLTKYLDAIKKAEDNNDDLKVRNLSKQLEYDIARRSAQAGNIDLLLEHIESHKFMQEMKESGLTDDKVQSKIKDLKETILFVEDQYKNMYDDLRNDPKSFSYMLTQKINERDAIKLKEEANLKINEINSKITQNNLINGTPLELQQLKNSLIEYQSAKKAIELNEARLKEINDDPKSYYDKKAKKYKSKKTNRVGKREIEYNQTAYEIEEQSTELYQKLYEAEDILNGLYKDYSKLNNISEEEIQKRLDTYSTLEDELIFQKAILKSQIEREKNSINNQNKFKNNKEFREEQLKKFDEEIIEDKKERQKAKDNEFKESVNQLSKDELNNIDKSQLTPSQNKVIEEKKTEIKTQEHINNKVNKNPSETRFRIAPLNEDDDYGDYNFMLYDNKKPVKAFKTEKEASEHIQDILYSEQIQTGNQVEEVIDIEEEPIITSNIKDNVNESLDKSSNTLNGEELPTGKKAGNNVTLAYLNLEYELDSEGNFYDLYDEQGNLIKANNNSRSMLTPGKFAPGKSIKIFIDNSKVTGNNNSDDLPIAIQLTEDNGKQITTWLHEVAWYYEADGKTLANGVKQEAVDEVKRIRKILFSNQDLVIETTLKGSTPGILNKVKINKEDSADKQWESLRGMNETFGGSNARIGFINRDGKFDAGENIKVLNKPTFNRRMNGMAFMFVPTAIEGYLATYINQRPINELKSKDRTIGIVANLIWNWAYNREALNKLGINTPNDIYAEIKKHIYLTQGETKGVNVDTRTFFKFYETNNNGAVIEFIENGKFDKEGGTHKFHLNSMKVSLSELKNVIVESFKYGKFPNISKEAANEFSNSPFAFIDIDEKGNLKENKTVVSNYLEFLDEFEYAKTNIQMIEDSEGNKTFVSQPVIAINTIDIGVKPNSKKNEGVDKVVNEDVKNISIESKKAEIEKNRQEELNRKRVSWDKGINATMPNNPNHKGFKVGQKWNDGYHAIVVDGGSADNWDGRDDYYEVISKIVSPAEYDDNGKLSKAAKVQVSQFNTKEDADKYLAKEHERIKSLAAKKEANVNARYDALLEKETIATKEEKVVEVPKDNIQETNPNNQFKDNWFEDDTELFLIKPETYNTATLANFKSTLGVHQQTQVVRQLTAIILDALDTQKKAKTTEEKLFKDLTSDSEISLDRIMDYTKDFLITVKNRNINNQSIANNIDTILNLFDGNNDFIGFRELIEQNISQLKFNINIGEDETIEEMEGSNDKTSHADNRNDRTDPERSMSGRIKRLLANFNEIHYKPEKQDDGSIKLVPFTERSVIGIPSKREPSAVFNFLTSLLADTPIKEMNDVLVDLSEDQTESGIICRQVLKVLSTLPKNEVNEFYSVMRLTNKTFKSLLYSKDKNGVPTISLINTNQNSAADILLNNWRSNLWVTAPDLISDVLDDGTIIWNKKEADKIGDKFNEWNKSDAKELNKLSNLFKSIGIIVSPQALTVYARFLKKEYKKTNPSKIKEINNKSLGEIIIERAGLNKIVKALGNKDIFFEESGIVKSLAKYENIVHPTVQSNSYRDDAGNMIYGIVPGTFADSQFRKLITDENYRLSLASTPFANSSRILNELIENNGNKDDRFGIFYLGALRNKAVRDSVTTFEEQNDFNKELTNINLFANNNSNSALHITVTPSDKTTFFLGQCSKMKLDGINFSNGEISFTDNSIALEQFTKYVLSEISRVNQTIEDYNKYKDIDKSKLISNYHYMIDKSTKDEVIGSGAYMMLFPELNNILKDYRLKNDLSTENGNAYRGQVILDENDKLFLKGYLKMFLTNMINDKINSWKDLGIYELTKDNKVKNLAINSQYTKPVLNKFKNAQDAINYMAADYMLNRMDWYINQYMLFEADPSFFYDGKSSDSTWENIIDATAKNLFKRTAKTVAPGRQGNWVNDTVNYLMINEPKSYSGLKINANVSDSVRKTYEDLLDISDAQEWISPEEYIRQLFAFGNITEDKYNELLNSIDNLSDEQIEVILQPIKPVYVNNQIDKNLNINVPYYIKTSAFPLLKQLVSGTELEKMLDLMRKYNVDRVVPKSAVKLGYRNNIEMFDNEGNIVVNEAQIQNNIIELSREGYRIQQEVPYDEAHDHSTWGSQFVKLRFADLPLGMTVKMNDKDLTIKQLKDLDDKIHREFYSRRWESLIKELGFERGPNGYEANDLTKLQKMLIEEASSQGLATNDLLMLKLINNNSIFDIPLLFQNNSDKLEALMQSLVKNRVLKFKLPGKSYVQGSSIGFKRSKIKIGENVINKGIRWIKGHNGEQLDYKVDDDGVYAEVVIAPYFLDKNKKSIDINNYIDKDGYIDTTKIDPELLTMVGYRIPTQGHNSMIRLKVVGFLPKSSGDLILVPAAITKQMGSDFDVDKLYVHNFNYYYDANNNIKKLSTKNSLTEELNDLSNEELENILLDISHSILRSNNEQIVNQILAELDTKPLNDVIKELDAITPDEDKINFTASASKMSGFINPDFHAFMVETNAAGKIGVGTWSVISVNHVLSQSAGLYIKIPRHPKTNEPLYDKAISVKFLDSNGKLFNDNINDENQITTLDANKDIYQTEGAWKLNKINTFESGKLISDVIKYIQSASVDNAKDQQLIRLNLNKHTFNVAGLIAETGFDERYIGAFLRQPIIVDYVKMLNNLDKITDSEFNPNKTKDATSKFIKEYLGLTGSLKFEDITPVTAISLEDMHNGIKNHIALKDDKEYKMFQARILVNFLKYNEVATELLSIRTANNTDTKLLDKSIAASIEKNTKLTNKLSNSINIGNVENLVNNTRQGGANDILNNSIELFTSINLFPIYNRTLNTIRDTIKVQLKKDDLNEKDILSITNAYRASIFSKMASDIFGMELEAMRDSLLYGDAVVDDNGNLTGDGSLAAMIVKYRLKNPNNNFLNALTVKLNGSNHPSFIEFSSAKDVKDEFNFGNPLSWMELLEYPEGSIEKTIGEKLIQYALIFGNERNARDFGRFIPVDYLNKINFGERIRDFLAEINLQTNDKIINNTINRIVTQWFQHNPNKATSIKSFDSFTNLLDLSGKPTKDDVYSFTLPNNYTNNPFIMSLATERDGMPMFISKFNEAKYKTELFKKTTKNEIITYVRINTLGLDKLMSEYNLDTNNASSILDSSKNVITKLADKEETIISPMITEVSLIKPEEKGELSITEKYDFQNNAKGVLTKLLQIGSTESIRSIAKHYLDNQLGYLSNIAFTTSDTKPDVYEANRINIHSSTDSDFNKIRLALGYDIKVSKDLETIILHEITHGILSAKLKPDNKNNLTPKEKEAVDELNKVFESAKNNEEIKIRIIESNKKYYWRALENIDEFTSVIMSDEGFRSILNGVTYNNKTKRTFLDKIVQLFRNIVMANVKSDSYLYQTLGNIIELTDKSQEQVIGQQKTISKPGEFINHSGGAYGGDTFWDLIGREFGVTNHKHYRNSDNVVLSQKLKNKGVKAEILTKKQMDFARNELEKLIGKKYPDTLQGNLQVRNYYQVINSDAIYAIAKLNNNATGVAGGTNTAIQLGVKLNKPVYVWDIDSENWWISVNNDDGNFLGFTPYIDENNSPETPVLAKNFAGIGSRDIENYNILNKETGKWESRKEYVGINKENKAKQAIRDVYEKTFGAIQNQQSETEEYLKEIKEINTSELGDTIAHFLIDDNGKKTTVQGFMKNLTPEGRAKLRKLILSKDVIFKCK